MDQLTSGLKLVAGTRLKAMLSRLTGNRFRGAAVGAAVTAIVQSSSVTTVLVVGFASAGLMTLAQSVAVIMGANVGTTVTAQVVAFDVAGYGLLAVAVGFFLQFVGKSRGSGHIGRVLMGLGLVFFGMELMGDATHPLRDAPAFASAMQSMSRPLVGILVAGAFTALVQSSSATTALVIVLASEGAVSLEAGIILVLGANIGTCVTAMMAAAGKRVEARRAAAVHVLFNVIGVVLWLGFVGYLADLVRMISPHAETLSGAAKLAAETPRQIANAHTVFNVANTLLLIWFVKPIAWVATKLVRPRDEEDQVVAPRYLDPALLQTPDLALDRVRMELRRVSDRIIRMLDDAWPSVATGGLTALDKLRLRDQEVDVLYARIVDYLSAISTESLHDDHVRLAQHYINTASNLESIGDLIETNLYNVGVTRLESGIRMSPATIEAFGRLHGRVVWAVRMASQAFDAGNPTMAGLVVDAKQDIVALSDELQVRLSARVGAPEADRRVLYQTESELLEYLKRIYYFAKQIAKRTVLLSATGAATTPDMTAAPDATAGREMTAGPDAPAGPS